MWQEEYQNLLQEFVSAVEDELLQYVRQLSVFGSYQKEQTSGPGWIIPGTSDLDLVLVVDLEDINPEKHTRRLAKIGEALSVFFVHPVYAPILDLTLLEFQDLPVSQGMVFSPIHAVSCSSQGEVLLGKNVLADTSYSEKMLNRCAKTSIAQGLESIKSGFLHRTVFGDHQLTYEFAEIILDMTHSALAAQGVFNLVRSEVPEKFEMIIGDKMEFDGGIDIVYEAKKWRMGSQKMKNADFLVGCLNFSQALNKFIRNPFVIAQQ
ncbi:MAG: hypothetical protein ACFFE8_08485 [Candidatus Heimdallarchaeota archaeon]